MRSSPPNDPLHGVTLERMLHELVERHGWPELAARISIRCFSHEPSIASSLKFLRRTPWARAAVERLYLAAHAERARKRKRNQARKARRAHAEAARAQQVGSEPLQTELTPSELAPNELAPKEQLPSDLPASKSPASKPAAIEPEAPRADAGAEQL